jgi:hypothetical protein
MRSDRVEGGGTDKEEVSSTKDKATGRLLSVMSTGVETSLSLCLRRKTAAALRASQ